MKKNVCPYLPASLFKGKDRWFIGFYQTDPATGKRIRIKQTFYLNRLPNLKHRAALGKQIEERINQLLPYGYPFLVDFDGHNLKKSRGVVSGGTPKTFAGSAGHGGKSTACC